MAVLLVPRRSVQLPLVARPQCNPYWTDLSSDAQRKIVRLVAQLLRQHRGTAADAEIVEEGTVTDKIKPHHLERKRFTTCANRRRIKFRTT